jgi:hypothetical protein
MVGLVIYANRQGELERTRNPQIAAPVLVHPDTGGVIVTLTPAKSSSTKKVPFLAAKGFQVCACNPNRKGIVVYNDSAQTVYLKFHSEGQPEASADDFGYPLAAGVVNEFLVAATAKVSAYAVTAVGCLRVTELS